jgi:hypothetical protein
MTLALVTVGVALLAWRERVIYARNRRRARRLFDAYLDSFSDPRPAAPLPRRFERCSRRRTSR